MSSNPIVSRIRSATDRVSWLPPLVVRIVLGVTFTLAGWGKLHNLDKITAYFASLGIPAASLQAPAIATIEFVGGLLLIVGLGTRLVSVLLFGTMAVAIYTAIWPDADGITSVLGGIEAIYLAAFLQLAVTGAGAASLDRVVTHFVPKLRIAAPAAAA